MGKKPNNTATGSIAILTKGTSHSINMFIIVTMPFVHTIKAPSRKPAVCCCVVVAAAYTNRGGRPCLPNCEFKAYILGDFNGRVGCDSDSWDGII